MAAPLDFSFCFFSRAVLIFGCSCLTWQLKRSRIRLTKGNKKAYVGKDQKEPKVVFGQSKYRIVLDFTNFGLTLAQ